MSVLISPVSLCSVQNVACQMKKKQVPINISAEQNTYAFFVWF